ncbi:MAG: BrnT family toxin [candidate division KSB1 bacterium]|mgnify:CR=1 FL=1
MSLTFEWDENKANANLRKHKVGFEEAKSVFDDPFLMTYPDPDHSEIEQRFLNVGASSMGRVLIVIHTDRGTNTRIISCRKATTSERKHYEEEAF